MNKELVLPASTLPIRVWILPGDIQDANDEHSMQRIAALLKMRDSVKLSSSRQQRRMHQQRLMLKARKAALQHEQAAARAQGLNPYEVTVNLEFTKWQQQAPVQTRKSEADQRSRYFASVSWKRPASKPRQSKMQPSSCRSNRSQSVLRGSANSGAGRRLKIRCAESCISQAFWVLLSLVVKLSKTKLTLSGLHMASFECCCRYMKLPYIDTSKKWDVLLQSIAATGETADSRLVTAAMSLSVQSASLAAGIEQLISHFSESWSCALILQISCRHALICQGVRA